MRSCILDRNVFARICVIILISSVTVQCEETTTEVVGKSSEKVVENDATTPSTTTTTDKYGQSYTVLRHTCIDYISLNAIVCIFCIKVNYQLINLL